MTLNDGEMSDRDQAEYDLMMQLDELESLKEEMDELGVSSLAEVEARIAELNGKLDELQRGG